MDETTQRMIIKMQDQIDQLKKEVKELKILVCSTTHLRKMKRL